MRLERTLSLPESIRETLRGLFPRIDRDATEAAKSGAPFDAEKLKAWAEFCVPLEDEVRKHTDTQAEAERRAAAMKTRLDAEELRLFGPDRARVCFCDGTGFERWDGQWVTEKGHPAVGPHVKRCRLWPRKEHPIWSENPRHYGRDEGEAVCPAAIQCARDRHRRKDQKIESERKGRTTRRYE